MGILPGQASAGPFLQKYDFDGNEVWTRQFGNATSQGKDLAVFGTAIYVVDGSSIRKFDTDGNSYWANQSFPLLGAALTGVSADASGVYLTGRVSSALPGQTHFGGNDVFVRKYDIDGVELWTSQFGTTGHDELEGISVDASGVYVAGWVPGGSGPFARDALVRAYALNGTVSWTRQFAGDANGDDQAFGIGVDGAQVYVVGYVSGNLPGQTAEARDSAFVRKYDSLGTEVWTRQFHGIDGPATDYASSVTASGNIYVVGAITGRFPGESPANIEDGYVRAYDPLGAVLWTRQFGTTAIGRVQPEDVAVDATGVYVVGAVAGTLPGQTSAGSFDAFISKFDFTGNELWTRQFGSTAADFGFGVATGEDGVYIVGRADGNLPGQSGPNGAFVRKYDAAGNPVWTHQFGSAVAHEVAVHDSVVYVVGSAAALPGSPTGGAYIRRYASTGSVLSTTQFGPVGFVDALSVAVNDAGVFLAGSTRVALPGQTIVGRRDAYLRYYDFNGNEIWTRQFGSIFDDDAFGVTVDEDAAYVIGNSFTGAPTFGVAPRDGFVRKFDLYGQQLWSTTINSTLGTAPNIDDSANAIAVDATGLYVAGSTAGQLPGETTAGLSDAFVAKLEPGEIFNVAIDVKPGGEQNSTNLSSQGFITIAILTTSLADGELLDFDATQVDASSVVFAEANSFVNAFEDVDHDGDLDLVLHFDVQDTNLDDVYADLVADDFNADGVLDSNRQLVEALLFGKTLDGDDLVGSDELNLFLSGRQLRDLLDAVFGG
jgi:hypothetical protein